VVESPAMPVPSRRSGIFAFAAPTCLLFLAGLPCAGALHPSGPGIIFVVAEGLSHAATLVALLLTFALLCGRILGRRIERACFAASVGIVSLLVAIDSTVFGALGSHLIGKDLAYLWAPGARQTLGITRSDILLAVAGCGVAAGVAGAFGSRLRLTLRRSITVAAVLMVLDGAFSLVSEVARFEGARPYLGLAEAMPLAWAPRIEPALIVLLHHEPRATEDDFEFPSPALLVPDFRTLRAASTLGTPESRPDILIVSLESLRADEMSSMAQLSNFAAKSVVATNHYGGGNCSFLSVFTLLSGLDPMFWSVEETWRAPNGLGAFAKMGYRVVLRNSAALNFGLVGHLLPKEQVTVIPASGSSISERDELTAKWAVDWVRTSHPTPEMAVVFFDAAHWPYSFDSQSEFRVGLADTWALRARAGEIRNRYHLTQQATDRRLGAVLDAVEANAGQRPILVVVTGDHGEAFGEHGVFMHGSRVDEEQIRVPLVMRLPGIGHVEVQQRTVHQDVLPTVLHRLGITPVAGPGLGIDFLSSAQRASPIQIGSCAISTADGYMAFSDHNRVLFQIDKLGTHFVKAKEPDGNVVMNANLPWIREVLASEERAYEERLEPRSQRARR
jgi:uncharacterized protein